MISNNIPLEHLAAFAFMMGVVSTIAISVYGKHMARRCRHPEGHTLLKRPVSWSVPSSTTC